MALLDHVFAIVEGLEAEYLDDTDGHADGGVLEFIEFGGHDVNVMFVVEADIMKSIVIANTTKETIIEFNG